MKGRAQTQKFRSAVTFTRPSIHFPYYIYARKIYVRTPAFSIKLFFLIANCIVCRFLVTQFLATKALGKNTLADMTWSDGSFPLFVRQLSQMCLRCILGLNLTSYLCSELYGHDWLKICRYKNRELWGLFTEVRKKSVLGFRSQLTFCYKIAVWNICRYPKHFYAYKKINNSFLIKVRLLLIKDA